MEFSSIWFTKNRKISLSIILRWVFVVLVLNFTSELNGLVAPFRKYTLPSPH